jgi:hypothetical protein
VLLELKIEFEAIDVAQAVITTPRKDNRDTSKNIFWPAFGPNAKYHPLFGKETLETWVKKAAIDKNYAAKGQVERWIADIKWYEAKTNNPFEIYMSIKIMSRYGIATKGSERLCYCHDANDDGIWPGMARSKKSKLENVMFWIYKERKLWLYRCCRRRDGEDQTMSTAHTKRDAHPTTW